jgi:uncharacterized membrane protein YuzA (DUF378 family)
MELKFTPWRVTVFVTLVVAYAAYGGFAVPPAVPRALMKMWLATLALFLFGAVSATVVDHWIGLMDRSNLRWFYIVVGVAGMAGALVMLHVFRERLAML